MMRISYYLVGTILCLSTLCSSAWANTGNCNFQAQQVSSAQRNVEIAQNNVAKEVNNLYRTQDQVEDRTLIMQAQVEQVRFDAQVVRSYPASAYGVCWGWNVWGLIQCGIARSNRRNIAIRNADVRVYQAQGRLENYVRYGQRLIERQAQRVVQAQQFLAFRNQQLQQANAALAECQSQQ